MDYFKDSFNYEVEELEEIEESRKDAYIENHTAELIENLENMATCFSSAIQNAVIVQQIINSKKKD